jgi:hypothetical protein
MSLGLFARAAGAAALVLSSAAVVQAAPVTYTIVGSESGLGVTGTIAGEGISGSITYTPGMTGQFTGDRGASGVTFSGGSVSAANKGSYRPAPGGDPTNTKTSPANFGFSTSSVLGAIRDLKFHIVSNGPTTIDSSGHIPADSFEIAIDSGTYAYVRDPDSAFAAGDDVDFSGTSPSSFKLNETPTKPTFSTVNGNEYLVLPFRFSIVTSTYTPGDTQLTFNGSVDATGPAVPEPTGLCVLAGAGLFLGRRRR